MNKFLRLLTLAALMCVPWVTQAQSFTWDFESDNEAWQFANVDGGNGWVIGTAESSTGSNSLYVSNDGGTTATYNNTSTVIYAWRDFTITTAGNYDYMFDWQCTGESAWDFMRVYLVPEDYITELTEQSSSYSNLRNNGAGPTIAGAIAIDGGSRLNTARNLGTGWHVQDGSVQLAVGTYRFLVVWLNDGSTANAPSGCIDNIYFVLPTCAKVIDVNVSDITNNSARINWSIQDGQSATYVIYNNGEEIATTAVGATYYDLTGLTGNTTYSTYSIKANCGGDGFSSPVVVSSFKTFCDPVEFPYSINFDEMSTGAVPDCWTRVGSHTSAVYNYTTYSSPYCLRFNGSTNNLMVMPLLNVEVNSTQVEFYTRAGGTAASYGTMQIGYMTNAADPTSFVALKTLQSSDYSAYTLVKVPMTTAPEGAVIAFRHQPTSTYSAWYIDDVSVVEAPNCVAVNPGTTTDITTTGARLNWVSTNSAATTYTISYTVGEEQVSVTTEPGVNYYDLTQLTPATAYGPFTVVANCGGGETSDPAVIPAIFTACVPFATGTTIDFEDMTANAVPDCWFRPEGAAGTAVVKNSTSYSHESTMYLDFRGSNKTLIVLPETEAAINTLQLRMWMRPESAVSASCGTFSVGYVTDINDTASFVAVETYSYNEFEGTSSSNTQYAQKTVMYNNAPAGVRMAMRHNANATNYYWYVDDITIEEVPNCMPVTSLANNPEDNTTSSVTLTWTDNNNGSATYVITDGEDNVIQQSQIQNLTATGVTITGLATNTAYTFKVRANCGTEGSEAIAIDVRTACGIEPLPFSENFDSYTGSTSTSVNNLPACWNYINTSTYNSYKGYPIVYSSASQAFSGTNYLRLYSYYSSYGSYDPQDQYAILPQMENLAGKQITLQAKGYNASSAFKVGVMSNPADASTFVEIGEQAVTTTYQEFVFDIPATISGQYVAFMIEAANADRTTNSVYIDDIYIAEAPTCIKPAGLAVIGNVQTATFTWRSEEAQQWQVAQATSAAADPNENIVALVNDSIYLANGLDIDEDYYFWVRSYCGATDQSLWVGPVSVHIGYCVPNPSSVDGKGITSVAFGSGDYVVNNTDSENGLPAASPFYGDYTSMVGAMQAGVESTVSITYSTGSSTVYSYGTIIWVDWDNSLGFEDDEIVYTGTSIQGSGGTPQVLEATFTIPATQALGQYRMRIAGADSHFDGYIGGNESADHTACFTSTYSVCHDYTIMVTEAPSCMPASAVTVNDITARTATLSWTNNNGNENFTVKQGDQVLTTIASDTYTLTGLTPDSTYAAGSFTIVANCDPTAVANVPAFTTEPSCLPVDEVTVENVTTNSARVIWHNENHTDGMTYTIMNGEVVLAAAVTASEYASEQQENMYSYDLSGLTTGTVYELSVIANCVGNDGSSVASEPVVFSTLFAIPIVEEFNGSNEPEGWSRYNGLFDATTGSATLTPATYGWSFGTSNGVFDNHAYVNIYGTTCNKWLVLPVVDMEANVQLSFDLALTAYSGSNVPAPATTGTDDKFIVLISTNGETWSVLRQWDNAGSEYVLNNIANTAIGQHVTIDLSNYAGQPVAIAFYGESTTTNADNNLHIDNVSIDYIPACAVPTGLAAYNVTAHGVTLGWTSDATLWQVCFDGDEQSLFVAGENPVTILGGLSAETAHTAKVRAVCDGNYSGWSNTVTFTTLVACQAPTELAATLTPGNGTVATFSWTENGTASNWVLEYSDDPEFTDAISNNVNGEATYDATGLTAEAVYYARVKAVCGDVDGESSWSDVISFIPTDAYSITLNDGTDINNTVPVHAVYADYSTRGQFIIPASDLESIAWSTINRMVFHSQTATGNFGTEVFNVYLAEVDNTVFETAALADWDEMSTVYSGTIAVSDNQMIINFTAPYTYEGGNLMVGFNEIEYSTQCPSIYWYGVNQPSGTYTAAYNDADYSHVWSATVNRAAFLPKVTIFYTPGEAPACQRAAAPNVGTVTARTAEISWTNNNGDNATYTVMQGETVLTTTAVESYTLTGLVPDSTYPTGAFTIVANCDQTAVTNVPTFTTEASCFPVDQVNAQDVTATSALVIWHNENHAEGMTYTIMIDNEAVATNVTATAYATEQVEDFYSYAISGLTAGTAYELSVIANCGGNDGSSVASVPVSFTTMFGIPLVEEFNGTGIPDGWLMYTGLFDAISGTPELTPSTYGWNFGTSNGVFDNHAYVNIYGTTCNKWLVLPVVDMETNVQLSFDLALTAYSGTLGAPQTTGTDDKFIVLITTDGETWSVLRQWDNAGSEYVYNDIANTAVGQHVAIDLSNYAGQSVAIAFYGESTTSNADNNLHIDNVSIDYIPACAKPADLAVAYQGGTTAVVSWTSEATLFNIDVNGTVVSNVTNPYTINDLTLGTTYEVKVQAVCNADAISQWTNPVSFTTDMCLADDQCLLTFELTDAWGDSWNGNAIQVKDVLTNAILGTLTNENLNGTTGSGENELNIKTLAVCDGRQIEFSWVAGQYPGEASYVVKDINGEEIFSGTGAMAEPVLYTVNCTPVSCAKPTELAVDYQGGTSATISWTSDAQNFNLNFNGTVISNVTNPYTINDLAYSTAYNFMVQAVCGETATSNWTNPVTLVTDYCAATDMCGVTVVLTDAYNDGWNGNSMNVVDVATNEIMETLTLSSGSDTTFVVNVCNGRVIDFVYVLGTSSYGTYPHENGYLITDINDSIIAEHEGCQNSSACDAPVAGVIAEYTVNCAVSTCREPSDLTVSAIGPNSATLSWTENGAAEAWIVAYKDATSTDFVEVNATTNPYTLGNLTAETGYTVKVRPACEDGKIKWSGEETFTTTGLCPVPNELATTDVTANSATLEWNGSGDSYNVRYRTAETPVVVFEDDFENNNLNNWTVYTEGEAAGQWRTIDPSSNLNFTAHSGSYVASAWSWNSSVIDADNWLVTPQVALGGTLKFWVRTNSSYPDDYAVMLSTTDNTVEDFTVTLQPMAAAPGTWTEVSIDLSAYANQQGYIAIHHVFEDGNYLLIDDFGVYGTPIPAGEWVTDTANAATKALTGLASETAYEFQVQGVCGETTTEWSESETFNTLPSCLAVNDLTAVGATTTTITLAWTNPNAPGTLYQVVEDVDVPLSITNLTDTGCVVTGLTPGTGHLFMVKAICGDGDESAWSNVVEANTECAAYEIPYVMDFEASDASLGCWNIYNVVNNTGLTTSRPYSGERSWFFYYTTNPPQYLLSPELSGTENGVQVEFSYAAYSASWDESFAVGYSTTTNDPNAFVWGASVVGLNNTSYERYYEVFDVEGIKYIAIKYTANDKYGLFIDSLVVRDIEQFDVTVNYDQTMGSVSSEPETLTNINRNTEVTLSATAVYGYQFVNWTEGETVLGTEPTLTFVADADHNISANFALATFTITATANADQGIATVVADTATGTPAATATVEYMSNVTLNAEPLTGFYFVKWITVEGEESVDASLEPTFTVQVLGDKTYTAIFDTNEYNVTVYKTIDAVNGNVEMGTVEGPATIKHFNNADYVPTANYGYQFVNWTDAFGTVLPAKPGTVNTLNIAAVSDTTVYANFNYNVYTVTGVSANSVMGSVAGTNEVNYLETVTLTATAEYGYHFVNWTEGETVLGTEPTITVVANADRTITANFDYNTYTVTGVSADLTMGSVSGSATVNYLSNVTLTATPEYGYVFVNWKEADTVYSTDATIEVEANAVRTLTAYFAKDMFTVTASVAAGCEAMGTVAPDTTVAEYMTPVTLTATPETGYHLVSWSNGATTDQITVLADSNRALVATFAINVYDITVSYDATRGTVYDAQSAVVANGTVYENVEHGTVLNFTATVNTGSRFAGWNDGNATVTTESIAYTATGTRTLTASFIDAGSYNVTLNYDNVMGTVTGAGAHQADNSVTITATGNYGYHFVAWVQGTDSIFTPSYTFTMPESEVEFTAVFDFNQYTLTAVSVDTVMGTVTGGATVNYLSNVTVLATTKYGYHFTHWYGNGINDTIATTVSTTIQVLGDSTVTANFDYNQYTVTGVSADATMGSVSGTATVNYLSTVTLTATPAAGYHFVNWTNAAGAVVGTDAELVVVAEADVTMTANFAITTAELAWSAESFTGYTFIDFNEWAPTVVNPHNVSVRYGCVEGNVPTQGGIYIDEQTGVIGMTTSSYGHVHTMTGTYHIYAVHETDQTYYYDSVVYTLTVENGVLISLSKTIDEGGEVTFSDYGTASTLTHFYDTTFMAFVAHGYTVDVDAEAAEGYHFVNWAAGDNISGYTPFATTAHVTYTVPDEMAVGLKAAFDTNVYNVTVNVNQNEGSVEGPATVKHFTSGTYTATATPCYHFVNWTDAAGNVLGTETTFTLSLPVSDTAINANFEPNVYAGDTTVNDVCDSFAWHGYTYYDTPEVAPTFVYQSVTGCDSTVTLHLTVKHSQTVVDQPVVACDSAMWNNTWYYQSGEQSVTVTGMNGCDSTTTVALTINNSQTVVLNPVSAYDSYEWNNETYTESGVLSYTTTGINGCDSTTTVMLTINHYDSVTVILSVNNEAWGSTDPVAGTYRFYPGETATATAIPANNDCVFAGWVVNGDTVSTSATVSIEILPIMAGMTFSVEAAFRSNVGIQSADYSNISIYSADSKVYVKGAEGMTIYIYDVNGRCMARRANASDSEIFAVETTGVLLIKAGDAPAKRVVVVR